ncbi:HD-GYP domain-containing protein [Shewanella sp. 10N.286.51.B2]|uniref:HD-GYP domain-containing protein n=1 Tax=Shewanella sp. 10N.286.51.B2 TaxID=3229707 RepID=UPI00354CED1B
MNKNIKISINQLQVGHFIRLPISWKDHPFLFSNFKLKSQSQIELLKSLNINDIYYDAERSDLGLIDLKPSANKNASTVVDPEELKQIKAKMESYKQIQIDAQKKLRRNLKKTEQQFERSIAMMRSSVSKLGSRPLNSVSDAKEMITDMTNMLLSSDDLVLHLMTDAKPNDVIFHHSLNVSTMCMMLAKNLNWPRDEIELIGLGALFHDLGKLKIPSNILSKQLPLTTPEKNLLKQHSLMSLNFLKLADSFPEQAKPMITNHHEYLDGSGYPKGLKGDQLDKYSQLISVINEYDNLCNGTKLSKPKTPYASLGLLYKNYKSKLNPEYVGKLIKTIGVYPPGSLIELSSGQFGMVMSVNLSKILFPQIMLYDPIVPKEQAPIIDLEKEDISIVRCLPASALPEKIFKYLSPRENISYAIGNA